METQTSKPRNGIESELTVGRRFGGSGDSRRAEQWFLMESVNHAGHVSLLSYEFQRLRRETSIYITTHCPLNWHDTGA